ncbi:hypothetical protein KQX54_008451 [Cotesia glomerata]|uniref:Uncharacterized protein n=1 Tax=Cotesia glomerata TaxID=32391 RepID=A0AAV7IGP0_COTGL|nr:hypothetical protein KQX54_008451 [Cotesia glomerata]
MLCEQIVHKKRNVTPEVGEDGELTEKNDGVDTEDPVALNQTPKETEVAQQGPLLDTEILEILGTNPYEKIEDSFKFHPEIKGRWKTWMKEEIVEGVRRGGGSPLRPLIDEAAVEEEVSQH